MTNTAPSNWPLFIVVLILLFFIITSWSVFQASSRISAITDTHYYSHGLKYNNTQIEHQTAKSLGWEMSTSVNNLMLEARLSAREGFTISSAQAEARIFPPSCEGTASDFRLPLSETSPGVYRVSLPATLKGENRVDVILRQGGARIERTLLIQL